MTKRLKLVERLKVAKASGMTTRLTLTPDEADAFEKLFSALDVDAIYAASADRYARIKRIEDAATRAFWWFLIWCGLWSGYPPLYAITTAIQGQ